MTEEIEYRIEHDTMGEVRVPKNALYAAQTQRAVENFPISGSGLEPAQIVALARIKRAAAIANSELGILDANAVGRIHLAATVNELLRTSRAISDAVDAGTLAVVGCQYRLTEGRAVPYTVVGPVAVELAPLD